jgi:hypothetical protein
MPGTSQLGAGIIDNLHVALFTKHMDYETEASWKDNWLLLLPTSSHADHGVVGHNLVNQVLISLDVIKGQTHLCQEGSDGLQERAKMS